MSRRTVYTWRRLVREPDGFIRYTHGETTDPHTPPTAEDGWQRIYSFGVGKVKDAGDSPPRPS